jgi:hypothetical protein
VLRRFRDGTRMAQLAVDNEIGKSTACSYSHEGTDAHRSWNPRCWRRRWPDTPMSASTAR